MKFFLFTAVLAGLPMNSIAAELTTLTNCNNMKQMPLIQRIDAMEAKANSMNRTVQNNGHKLGAIPAGPNRDSACQTYSAQLSEYNNLLTELNKSINVARPAVKALGEDSCYEEITNDNRIMADNWKAAREHHSLHCRGGNNAPANSGGGGR